MNVIYIADLEGRTSQDKLPAEPAEVVQFSFLTRRQRTFIENNLYGREILDHLQSLGTRGIQRVPLIHQVRRVFGHTAYHCDVGIALIEAKSVGFAIEDLT